MNPLLQFQASLYQCNADSTISLDAKNEYSKLVSRSAIDGFTIIIPLDEVGEEQENALRELKKAGFIQYVLLHDSVNGHHFMVELKEKSPAVPQTVQGTDKREVFSTGAVRDTAERKSRPDLFSAFAMERIGEVLRQGSLKYGERNFEAGIPLSRCLASLHRHLMKFQQHSEDGEDHMASVVCNAMFILHNLELIKRGVLPAELDDLPKYQNIPRVHFNGD